MDTEAMLKKIEALIVDLEALVEQRFAEVLEIITRSGTKETKPKTKRKPGKYALFMKDCLKKKKSLPMAHTDKFKECAKEYQKSKNG